MTFLLCDPCVSGVIPFILEVTLFVDVLCVVCCHPINSGRQVICGRISRGHTGGRPHRISHPPSFCGASLNFSGENDLAIPFPRRP